MRSLALAFAFVLVAGAAPAPAIFRGSAVDPASAPWMVAFRARSTVCGGAVIAPDRVLTAAHCVAGVSPRRLRLFVGGQPLSAAPRRVGWRGAAFPLDFKLIPSLTEPLNPLSSSSVNDIAIVQLDRPLAGVPPLRVADAPPAPGETTIAYGRGDTGDGPSDALMAVRQQAIGAAQCGAAYRRAFRAERHLCGLDPTPAGGQACGGDSGGPVVVERDGAPRLVGVVTWGGEVRGRGCGEGLPDVSELVTAHRELLTGPVRALAPWAHRRVRARRCADVRDRPLDTGTRTLRGDLVPPCAGLAA